MDTFNKCSSIQKIDMPNSALFNIRKMISLDAMNFNQINYCKENNLINEIGREVANSLNICNFYAIIEGDKLDYFNAL